MVGVPEALPGIELGSTDLLVIDTDQHETGEDGVSAFASLKAVYADERSQPKTLTAGLGEHFFFRQVPDNVLGNSEGGLPPGINVRGNGGFVVAPGAVGPTERYGSPLQARPTWWRLSRLALYRRCRSGFLISFSPEGCGAKRPPRRPALALERALTPPLHLKRRATTLRPARSVAATIGLMQRPTGWVE